jgi:isocitrate dehydrogenase
VQKLKEKRLLCTLKATMMKFSDQLFLVLLSKFFFATVFEKNKTLFTQLNIDTEMD